MELPDVQLFRGLTADEAEAAVTALRMRRRAFAKGEILLEAGQRAPALGVVLILVGIYALLHPVVSLISLGWCVAFVFIAQGINLVFAAISTKSEDAA